MFTRLILLPASLNSSAFILIHFYFIYIGTEVNETHSNVAFIVNLQADHISARWPLQLQNTVYA